VVGEVVVHFHPVCQGTEFYGRSKDFSCGPVDFRVEHFEPEES